MRVCGRSRVGTDSARVWGPRAWGQIPQGVCPRCAAGSAKDNCQRNEADVASVDAAPPSAGVPDPHLPRHHRTIARDAAAEGPLRAIPQRTARPLGPCVRGGFRPRRSFPSDMRPMAVSRATRGTRNDGCNQRTVGWSQIESRPFMHCGIARRGQTPSGSARGIRSSTFRSELTHDNGRYVKLSFERLETPYSRPP